MKAALNILNKAMINQFYVQNAGLFLFAFLFFFGVVDAGHIIYYHKSLMLSMISLPLFLFFVMIAWMLYAAKCAVFCINIITAADGSFLYQLRALVKGRQWLLYILTGTLLCLPVLVYAIVFAKFAYSINAISVSVQVIACQLLMITFIAASIFIAINRTRESFIVRVSAAIRKMFTVKKGYPFFTLAYILNERKTAFAVVKIFSLLMLGMLLVRNGDSFDADLFAIFYPLIITAHASLVMYCTHFNETLLSFNRNLPVHWLQVAAMYCFTWFIILLPETAFMFINNNGNIPVIQIFMQALTAVFLLFAYTGIALGCGLNMERYLLFIFMSYIMILILQRAIGHTLAAVASASLALLVFKSYYYSFEREKVN